MKVGQPPHEVSLTLVDDKVNQKGLNDRFRIKIASSFEKPLFGVSTQLSIKTDAKEGGTVCEEEHKNIKSLHKLKEAL